ncbi:amidohydrolase family protein [bacterium]|nr:amidohydrolase family protein [bacterium]
MRAEGDDTGQRGREVSVDSDRSAIAPVRRVAGSDLLDVSRVAARWVFPIDRPPLEHGVVDIKAGRIVEVRQQAGAADDATLDLGNVALLPALVNAHAHLEFSDLAEPIQPPAPFTQWIRNLLAYRRDREQSSDELVRDGLREAGQTGTGLIGEIATGDWSVDGLTKTECLDAPMVVAFRELIGLSSEQTAGQLELAQQHIDECRRLACDATTKLIPALSPHAPYSVSPDLFQQSVELARRESVPLCIHLAETPAELELLDHGTGEFVEMLSGFGLWQDNLIPRGLRPLDFLEPLATLDNALIAHGNFLSADEITWLGRHPNVATVFCPRTHAFFGHTGHPWQKLLAAGATVCLGTDGRSSNPDYSLWPELQFLARLNPRSERTVLLELATLSGARALGLEADYGSLTVGKRSDFCAVDLSSPDANAVFNGLF